MVVRNLGGERVGDTHRSSLLVISFRFHFLFLRRVMRSPLYPPAAPAAANITQLTVSNSSILSHCDSQDWGHMPPAVDDQASPFHLMDLIKMFENISLLKWFLVEEIPS